MRECDSIFVDVTMRCKERNIPKKSIFYEVLNIRSKVK